jgi:CO/xanthine dehydrogenase FAD-binding subunit
MGDYLRPRSVSEALDALRDGRPTILAGGTDYYPARVGRAPVDDILDLSGLDALRGIEARDGQWRIGALATWSELLRADLPPAFDGLKRAAREVGGMQIQNTGTVCGNLCNASPAADGVPPLLTLDATVELSSADGVERVALEQFITGNRRTTRRPDQLVTAILVPAPADGARGHFLKLGARRYLVISIVMVAATIETDADGGVRAARVAVGACAPVARRLPALEAALVGRRVDERLGAAAEAAHLAPLSPIDDIRASAAYRHDAALTLVQRCLAGLGAMA